MSKYHLKIIVIIISLMACTFLNAQVQVQSSVWDTLTQKPLPYCNIVIKNRNDGAITNADGKFILNAKYLSDSLLVSYLGYAKRTIAVKDVRENDKIYLQPQSIELLGVTVTSESDYFYDIVSKSRKNLQKNKSKHNAKVYYGLNTTRDNVPVEVLECYFNCDMRGITMNNFSLKNGKVGLKNKDALVFLSFNLSQLVSSLNLTVNNGFYPYLPFHFNKEQLKKRYRLNGVFIDNCYKISFTPLIHDNKYFSGIMWIEKGTNNLLKLELAIDKTDVHPLIPREKINNLSLYLTYYFTTTEQEILLSHVDFKYALDFEYAIRKITPDTLEVETLTYSTRVNTNGLVYCYDYDNPFILPYFNYAKSMDDYQKLALFPYNHLFWANSKLLLSEAQTSMLRSMNREDLIFNSDSVTYGKHFMKNLTNNESGLSIGRSKYFFWSSDDRLEYEMKEKRSDSRDNILYAPIYKSPVPEYKLNSQIFLDINTINDINHCTSYSVFNADDSYLHVPDDTLTRIFINLYFDIVEIERRKMQNKLDANTFTLKQIDEIYYATLDKIEAATNNYFADVVLRTNENNKVILWSSEEKLKKWSQYVYENLGIRSILFHCF